MNKLHRILAGLACAALAPPALAQTYPDKPIRVILSVPAGGIWHPRHRLWEVNWKTVRELGLQERVVEQAAG